MTRKQAIEALKDYWHGNGFTQWELSNFDEYDIKCLMAGDLTRLMIDPHKYDDCE
jgi:hypothetical protein